MVSRTKPITLRTEATSIRDWESVCEHVLHRTQSIVAETHELIKLFTALAQSYTQKTEMCARMHDMIATKTNYAGTGGGGGDDADGDGVTINDFYETDVHKGCDLVRQSLKIMSESYGDLAARLTQMCGDIGEKSQKWDAFIAETAPITERTRDTYLSKERELQQTMHIYMRAAEQNDRGFFLIAKEYQKKLIEFQSALREGSATMLSIINGVQSVEAEKADFERTMQREFIERALEGQEQIEAAYNGALQKLQELDGEQSWKELTARLGLFKENVARHNNNDNDDDSNNNNNNNTVFDDPVPNKAGALIKSWMERDLELTASVYFVKPQRLRGTNQAKHMVVTRWGFVQVFDTPDAIQALCEFYIYDYEVVESANVVPNIGGGGGDNGGHQQYDEDPINDENSLRLKVRQHQMFAPLKGIETHFVIRFDSGEDKDQFAELMNEFQQTHAPQT